MRGTSGILFVRNVEQQAVFELELKGQLSDGAWENSRPYDHWVVWSDAEVKVAGPSNALGRNFFARRTVYNFARTDLLDVVGKRMLGKARLVRHLGYGLAEELQWDVDCNGLIDFEVKPSLDDYWVKRQARLNAYDQAVVNMALTDESYGMEDLKRDLRELNAIVKIYNT